MQAVLFGGTGLTGGCILDLLKYDSDFKSIIVVSRKTLTHSSNKISNKVIDFFKENDVQYINAELTLRADTLVDLDQDMSEKVFNIMELMDDLDDVQEVHTNAEFPENFEIKE